MKYATIYRMAILDDCQIGTLWPYPSNPKKKLQENIVNKILPILLLF